MAEELTTSDDLVYQFKPVTSGGLTFKVRTANDAHIALTAAPSDSEPIVEVFIGGWGNSKTVIRKNKAKPEKAEADTPGILNDSEFRGFWLRWSGGHIALGKEGEAAPFIQWEDPEPLVSTTMASVPDGVPPAPGSLMAEKPTPNLLGADRFFGVDIVWQMNGHLTVHNSETKELLLLWQSPTPLQFTFFGVRTGWGARGKWILEKGTGAHPGAVLPKPSAPPLAKAPQPGWSLPQASATGGAACWVATKGGEIPPNAVPGGFDNEQLYIGRARHEGALLPGKVVPSHGVCYVPWGGAEHGKDEYEVLCGCEAAWIQAVGGNLPEGALPSGESEDGEPLFVGRAQHEGTVTVGKVQASHNCCYIPYGGQEIGYPEYEVLVAKN